MTGIIDAVTPDAVRRLLWTVTDMTDDKARELADEWTADGETDANIRSVADQNR